MDSEIACGIVADHGRHLGWLYRKGGALCALQPEIVADSLEQQAQVHRRSAPNWPRGG
jgi:hypothetical protein